MKKSTYYFFKIILPDFLLTILFLLLFDILNFKIDIINSSFVWKFAITFTFFDYVINELLNYIQLLTIKKMSVSDILFTKKNKVMYYLLFFKIIGFLISIGLLYITSVIYNNFIVFEKIYIYFVFALILAITKLLLNQVINLEKMIMGTSQKELDKNMEDLFQKMMDSDELNNSLTDEEKEEKINKGIEELIEKISKNKNPEDRDDDGRGE